MSLSLSKSRIPRKASFSPSLCLYLCLCLCLCICHCLFVGQVNVDGPVPPLVDQQLAWGSPGATGCQHRTCQAVDSRLHCKESKYVFIRFFKTRGKSSWEKKSQSFNVKSLSTFAKESWSPFRRTLLWDK